MTTATVPTLELDAILALIDAEPENMCGPPQPEFLFELSRSTCGSIVEIGTCAGKSTIALAYGQKVRHGLPLTTIDLTTHERIEANLTRAGVRDYVRRIISPSATAAAKWTLPIDLLWIDGDHRYKGVRADIRAWSKFVPVGGLMAFHDYPAPGAMKPEVGRAICEEVLKYPREWRVKVDREAGSIIVFERLAQPQQRSWYSSR